MIKKSCGIISIVLLLGFGIAPVIAQETPSGAEQILFLSNRDGNDDVFE